MKKSLLALAALTAFAGAASAQSSVTLFGIVDVNARYVQNGSAPSLKTLSTDGNASSRLGFRGIEDLGGGLRAGFWIEGALSPDVGGGQKNPAVTPINGGGATGMDWQRRSTVSLIGNFGELRLGRDYTPTFTNVVTYDMFGYVGVASITNVRSSLGAVTTATGAVTPSGATTAVRASNTIGYLLPAMGGLYGSGLVAAGEGSTGNKYVGARLGYAAGPVNVSGSYGKTYQTGTMVDNLKVMNFGGSFNLGFVILQGLVEKSDYSNAQQKLYSFGVQVPVGASNFKLNGVRASGSVDNFAATQIGAGYEYNLSKRTLLYANAARIQNKSYLNAAGVSVGSTFTSSSGGAAGIKPGETSKGYEAGIRHNF